jgi:hypothetical protein
MINGSLYCFILTHSPLPKDFSLKLKIHRYNQTIRNLQSQEGNEEAKDEEIILTTKDDSNGTRNSILSFSSEPIFEEDEHVKIKELNYNEDDNGITHDVVENNHLSINFDNSSEMVDTRMVAKLIQDNKVPNFSPNTDPNEMIINLNLDNINGCEFDLNSDKILESSDNNYNFELAEYNNEKIVNAQCSISQNNLINCKINQDADNEFYFYKSIMFSNYGKYIILPNGSEHKFKLFCKNNSNKNKFIILAVCLIILVILILLISTRFCCKKDSKKDSKKGIKNDSKKDSQKDNKNKESFLNNEEKLGGSSSKNELIKKTNSQ